MSIGEQGWITDTDHYYSDPPYRMLRSSRLSGTLNQVWLQARLLVALAHSLNVTLQPPPVTVIRISAPDRYLDEEGQPTLPESRHRIIHQPFARVFPVTQLILDNYVNLVEPDYLEHAQPFLSPQSLAKYHDKPLEIRLSDFETPQALTQRLSILINSSSWGEDFRELILDNWEHSRYEQWTVAQFLTAGSDNLSSYTDPVDRRPHEITGEITSEPTLFQPCSSWWRDTFLDRVPPYWCGPFDWLDDVRD